MKSSIQALRVDSAKQQLLESRMTSSTSPRQDSSNSAAGQTSQTGQTTRVADAPSQPGTLTSQATQSSSEPPPSSLDRATPDHNHHNHNSSSGAHFLAITHHTSNNNSINNNINNLNSNNAATGNSNVHASSANTHTSYYCSANLNLNSINASVNFNSNNNCHCSSYEPDNENDGGNDNNDNVCGGAAAAAAADGVHGHGSGPALGPGDSGAPLAVATTAVAIAATAAQHASPTRQLSSTAKRRRKPKIDSPNSKKICNRTEKRIDEIFKTQPNFQQQPPLQQPQPSSVPSQPLQPQQQQPQPQQQQSQLLQQIQHSQHQSQQYQQSVRVSPYRNSCSDSSGDSIHESHPLATPPILSSSNNKVFFSTCSSLKKESIDPCLNRDQLNFLDHNSDNPKPPSLNSSDITIHNQNDSSVISLKGRVENLEQELEERSKEIEQLKEYRRKAREVLIKTLMQQSELERRATRERVNNNKLYLGQFRSYRQGAHYEEKWTEGLKYQDLEKKRKWIEEQRDENEKRKKMWNKRKPASEKTKQSKQKGSPELEPNEFYWQAEIHDIRKLNINKEEKDLQAETERLDRERNLHIREIKRIDNEESSRFRDFPILNDRYLLLCLLGKGGFSEVYKGFDLEQLCLVACKIHELNPSWPQDKKDSYIKHALREISIHKRLEHRRIVRVHDVFNIDNDAFCTVLEHCDGNDLDFYLKQNKCIPERDAKSLVCQLVSALRYLNDRKNPIIHYDLKPGNILLCNNGEIKITDFGLSKIFPDDHHNPDGMELTSQGAGTYWYLPPECFVTENGPPTISSKVDVWSVGVIFYQALYGKKPFGNNMTQTDILHNNTILQARHISFPSFPKISDAAKEFIKRCCTYRKDLRPDVFQLCNDDYLKPKAQLKHSVDVAVLPGPSTSSSLTVPHSLTQSQSQSQHQHQHQHQLQSSLPITSGSNHY